MIRPTPRALWWMALGVPLSLVPAALAERLWPVWVACTALLLLALATDLVLAPPARALSLSVEAPAFVYVGDAPGRLLVRLALGGRDRACEARLELSPPLAEVPAQVVQLAQGRATLEFPLAVARRGPGQVGRLFLRWSGPLGLVLREHSVALDRTVLASPNLRGVREAAVRFFGSREQSGPSIERFKGDGSEFDALREFAPGNDRRAIDWKASARHRQLLVREFRAEKNRQVVLALDTGHLMSEPLEGIARLDHAINSALVLAWASLRTGDRVGLFGFDAEVRCWAPPRGAPRRSRGWSGSAPRWWRRPARRTSRSASPTSPPGCGAARWWCC